MKTKIVTIKDNELLVFEKEISFKLNDDFSFMGVKFIVIEVEYHSDYHKIVVQPKHEYMYENGIF